QRIGTMGDGWFPWRPPNDDMRAQVERLHGYARAAGRSPTDIGLEPQLSVGRVPPHEWESYAHDWQQLGATHLCVNTMGAGYSSLDEHITVLRMVKETLGL
ncbi:MAG TPA: hypothetical protein VEZ12_00035, partial [Herpetosiphonaceae bacterium]|nr:hypothetical protein [Herpetosiphonaceae bacterium]